MEIGDFLRTHVEGYLFEDLDSMARINGDPNRTFGAVVYPMIAISLAGAELLGNLVNVTGPFDPFAGQAVFQSFWQGYLYPGPSHHGSLARVVYELTRHGLAHVFLAKPGIIATKNGDPARHLCRDVDGALLIDALVLKDDLWSAYETRVKPLVSATQPGGPGRATMQSRLDEMSRTYLGQSRKFANSVIRLPIAPTSAPHVIQINSPSASSTISASKSGSWPSTPAAPQSPQRK